MTKKRFITAILIIMLITTFVCGIATGCEKKHPKLLDSISLKDIKRIDFYDSSYYVEETDERIERTVTLNEEETQAFFEMLKPLRYRRATPNEMGTLSFTTGYIIYYYGGGYLRLNEHIIWPMYTEGPEYGQYVFLGGEFRYYDDLMK